MALAKRLGEVLPSPLTVRADGSGISLYGDGELLGGSGSANVVEDEDGTTFQERVGGTVLTVLSEIQDCVMRYLREEWPTDDSGRWAEPRARVEGGRIHPWYGSEDKPVISLRPIEFDEILTGERWES